MLLNYKKVSDILSLDDFNAIVYLLRRGYTIEEHIILQEKYFGEYGVYQTKFDKETSIKDDSYVVDDLNNQFVLTIDNDYSGIYSLKLNVLKVGEKREAVGDEEQKKSSTIEKNYVSNNLNDRQQITVPFSDFNKGDLIRFRASVEINYNNHEIDKTSGSIEFDSNQNILRTVEALEGAILNANENETTTIYVDGGLTYSFRNELIIENKTINILSTSVPATFTTDTENRLFYVKHNAVLNLTNVKLEGGKAVDGKGGGAVYVESFIDSNYIKTQGRFRADECKFVDNISISQGGAVFSDDGIIELNNCLFFNNQAKNKNGVFGDGGAIYIKGVDA